MVLPGGFAQCQLIVYNICEMNDDKLGGASVKLQFLLGQIRA